MPRFFVENNEAQNGEIVLRGADALHISRSLRMAPGEPLTVCDMARNEYDCEVLAFTPETVTVKVLSVRPSENEPPHEIRLYQAMPKSDKFDTIVQKAVETGACEIIPFYSERCIARPKDSSVGRKLERWNRIAAEAAGQCGRGRLVRVAEPLDYHAAVQAAAAASLPLFCYEGDEVTPLRSLLRSHPSPLTDLSLMIGPEGGFSVEEAAHAREHGMSAAGLGKRILRCETASVFALAALAYEFELS